MLCRGKFKSIANETNVTFLSLQKGYGSEQLETCSFKNRFVGIQSKITQVWDFLETAAIIECCDLFLSADTSVVHLAAGMGKETWLLLKYDNDWRWGVGSDRTFWYKSVRIFRQLEMGNWDDVIKEVSKELKHRFC